MEQAKRMRSGASLKKLSRIAEQLGTVTREGLTEKLVQKLESLAMRGVISPEERLPPERELARMLGVSRSSLRQALKALQIMGVLEMRQGSGTYLAQRAKEILSVPPKILVPLRGLTQAELFEVRRALEGESAATAAERATDADLHGIRLEVERMRESLDDRFAYGTHDLAFHQAIATAAGNRFFVWFLGLANKVLCQAWLKRPQQRSLAESQREHESIFRAVESRDPIAAREEMLRHVSYQKYYLLDPKMQAEIGFMAQEPRRRELKSDESFGLEPVSVHARRADGDAD